MLFASALPVIVGVVSLVVVEDVVSDDGALGGISSSIFVSFKTLFTVTFTVCLETVPSRFVALITTRYSLPL